MVCFYFLQGGRWGKSFLHSPFLHWKIQEYLWGGKGVWKIVLLNLIIRKSSEIAFLKISHPWPTSKLITHLTDSCVWIQHANFDKLASSHYVQSILKKMTVPWASKEYFQDQMMETLKYVKWHYKNIKLRCVLNGRLLQNFVERKTNSFLKIQFLFGVHSLKQVLNTTYIMTQ